MKTLNTNVTQERQILPIVSNRLEAKKWERGEIANPKQIKKVYLHVGVVVHLVKFSPCRHKDLNSNLRVH